MDLEEVTAQCGALLAARYRGVPTVEQPARYNERGAMRNRARVPASNLGKF